MPDPVETMDQFDALLNSIPDLGTSNDPSASQQPTQVQDPPAAEPGAIPEPAAPAESAPTEPTQATVPAQANNTKQATAFAQMRVQNKQYNEVLQTILQRAGLDPSLASNLDGLKQMLADADTHQQAEEMKVPPELLKRLNQLEQTNAQFEQQRLYNAAIAGFQQVQNEFKLTEQQVLDFAKQLQDNGVNPFAQEMDLVREYKLANFDSIQNQRIEAAVQAALAKQSAAQQHSSTPSATKSKPDTGASEGKITDMASFERFLKDNNI